MKIVAETQDTIIVRLEKDENIIATLLGWFADSHYGGAWVQGMGGVSWAEIGYYDLDAQQYHWQSFSSAMEIANLCGSLAWKEKDPIAHLHITLSDGKMSAYGGHLKEAVVGGTCELMIRPLERTMKRVHDKASGLYLLDAE